MSDLEFSFELAEYKNYFRLLYYPFLKYECNYAICLRDCIKRAFDQIKYPIFDWVNLIFLTLPL